MKLSKLDRLDCYIRVNVILTVKHLSIKSNQGAERSIYENYKTLMKEVEEDTNKWKDIPCLWIGRINIFIVQFA